MKHSTFIIAMALGTTLSAQAQSFKQVEQEKNQEKFMPLHRGIVSFADVDGDGRLDVVYGGQYRPDNGTDGSGDVTFETDADGNIVTDADGSNIVKSHTKWAVQGDPENPNSWFSLSWACTANIFYNQGGGNYTHEVASSWHHWGEGSRTSTEARGLLPTTWGGYHFFDANNDGRLDAYIYGQDEWGWKFSEYSGQKIGDDNQYVAFQLQNTDGLFELQPNTFPKGWNENTNSLGNRANSSVAFGDYDHDGFTDVLIQCYHKWMEEEEECGERLVGLYHNNGDGTFQQVNVFKPIPFAENLKPADLFEANLESGDMVPTMKAKPMSHGAIAFGDLNGDGWLDIISTGWSNDDEALSFYIYQNMQDGTFQELDLSGKSFLPVYESEIQVADINNDGWLDIVVFGTQNGEGMPKVGDVYLNDGDGEFNFTRSSVEQGNGLFGASAAYAKLVDINHDGLTDVFSYGWSDVDGRGWGARIHTQNTDGTFTLDTDFGDPNTAYLALGDVNDDGALDVSGDYWFDFGIWESQFTDDIEAPEAPTGVKAEQKEDGRLTISWTGDELNPGYAYNLYIKNKVTGAISQLIPASIETGALRTTQDLGVALRSDDPSAMSYTLSAPDGDYEVGVQTMKNDWTTSAFTKAEVTIASGIQSTKAIPTTVTRIYNANGRYMGSNPANLGRGLFIIEKGGSFTKVIK